LIPFAKGKRRIEFLFPLFEKEGPEEIYDKREQQHNNEKVNRDIISRIFIQ